MGTNYYFSLFSSEKNVYFSKDFSLWMSPKSFVSELEVRVFQNHPEILL